MATARNILVVYRKELREALRDRRTLISSIVVPLILFPVLSIALGYTAAELFGEIGRQPSRIMILGGKDSPAIVGGLKEAKNLRILPAATDYADQISDKKIRAAVEIPDGFQHDAELGQHPDIKIYIFSGDLKSATAANRIEQFFRDYRDSLVRTRLTSHQLPESLMKPFDIDRQNVVPVEKVAGETYGGLIPYLAILMCMTGAMYPAMDLTAGEKERGTMETILSSPVSRTHLVLGKFLLVLTASLATATLSVISMTGSFTVLSHIVPPQSGGEGLPIIPIHAKTALAVFLVSVPIGALFSSAMITIALFAKTFKEAQSYLTPMTFLVIFPAIAAVIPGVELNSRLALVPILNVSLLCKELITGTYHWSYIAVTFLSTCVWAAAALFLAVKMFQRESVLFSS
jgi:sodium transport system permease protein